MNINNTYNDDNNNNSGGDNRGKFSDRIKKINRDRLKYKKGVPDKEEGMLKRGSRNIFKIVLAMPSVVYTNIKSSKEKHTNNASLNGVVTQDNAFSYDNSRKIKVNSIKEINISLLKEKKKIYLKNKKNILLHRSFVLNEKEKRIQELQKEIISLIKKRLVKNLNELEVLQSEMYVLSELTGDRVHLIECEEDIKEIKRLLSKIKSLKEKYDYLKDNVDFEYMLEYGEDFLVDKILELKDLCSLDDVRYVVDNYKILDEYKYLYLKIDKIYDDSLRLNEHKEKEIDKLKERDIDFEKFKNELYDVDRENNRYQLFVDEQEEFLKQLDEKVSKIDSRENVTYRLKGFNQLLGNSFKYLGLLLVSPLKGLIPGIATQTLITRNMVRNLYGRLEWEVDKKTIYEAINYADEIERCINNLDDTTNLVNATLSDIVALKAKYKSKFSEYEGNVPGYRDAISRINKMENALLGNKIKIDLMKSRMKEKERQNKNKLKLVKKLNNSHDNSGNA